MPDPNAVQETTTATDHSAVPLPLRGDTILGICEAIGQDFGFNPNWLRVALAAVVLLSPMAAIAAYAGLGIIVAGSRLLFPDRKLAAAADLTADVRVSEANDSGREDLPRAA